MATTSPQTEQDLMLNTSYEVIELYGGLKAFIDKEDFERVSKFKWSPSKDGERIYVKTRHRISPNKYTNFQLHRLVLNAPKGKDVDHINHNTLDNRKSNLRLCTRGENKINSLKKITNKTGYKGVQLRKEMKGKSDRVWRAVICKAGKIKNLGQFKSAKEAAIAYNETAKILHGEFACLNLV
jgi:hypothetical protein